MKEIKVIELFAGVGGFRVGLERASKKFNTVWSNQWEPSTKKQYASDIYVERFGKAGHANTDISKVPAKDIPDHDMLVGGFPCQDYSVAKTLKSSSGIEGKKGVLWWEIHRILSEKKKRPQFLLLENVDRLLKSPVRQRGRDFAIMLASLADLGYIVEWRIINAADHGMPQRRRRIFIVGYHKDAPVHARIKKYKRPIDWVLNDGTMAKAFEVSTDAKATAKEFELKGSLDELTKNFNIKGTKASPFENAGIMTGRKVFTIDTRPNYDGPRVTLGDIIVEDKMVDAKFYIDDASLEKWKYLKGAKQEKRTDSVSGFEYNYSEGAMVFPDALDKPSRTIITGEGGSSASRVKHVIKTKGGKLRRLTPVELERLNMFPDGHTEGAPDIKRAFFMGNALVVGVVERIGRVLMDIIGREERRKENGVPAAKDGHK